MPNKEDTEKALELLKEDLEKLDCEIRNEIDQKVEEQHVRGLNCIKGEGYPFQVLTVIDEEVPFFEVRYSFNAQQV
ncbi:MAG: hypothetical protein ABEJ98_00750, partial [Candidatus Nanohaloarchaea archaeon]